MPSHARIWKVEMMGFDDRESSRMTLRAVVWATWKDGHALY